MLNKILRSNYEKAVNNYVDTFIVKHFEDTQVEYYWVAQEVGGILCVNDYFINFLDIVNDIDNNVPKNIIFDYLEYSEKVYEYTHIKINYKSYLNGYRVNGLDNIEKIKENLNSLIKTAQQDYETEGFVG